jgi:probable rRNA maturation factor
MLISINDLVKSSVKQSYVEKVIRTAYHQIKKTSKDYQLSVAFVDDQTIRHLNKKFRNKNKTTTILSFAYSKKSGEIILGWPEIKRKSLISKIKLNDYLKILLVHGLLHLFGYQHYNLKKARLMEKIEDKIIKAIP